MNGRRVLVTGATGAVGPTVLRALKEAGWSPRVLAQPGSENVLRELDVEARTGDIADPSALGPAMEGISTVVHMAALLHETGSRSPASEYERVNVQGTVATLAAARRAGVSRLVLMSTRLPSTASWVGPSRTKARSLARTLHTPGPSSLPSSSRWRQPTLTAAHSPRCCEPGRSTALE